MYASSTWTQNSHGVARNGTGLICKNNAAYEKREKRKQGARKTGT